MIVILDASTLINLVNGGVLATILGLPAMTFQVSTIVRQESRSIARAVDAAVSTGRINLVDDSLISATEFIAAKSEMNLDDGETECILAAQKIGAAVATDDRAARAQIEAKLGRTRLSGSIGLLQKAVSAGALSSADAFGAYSLMKQRGGFLPDLAAADF